MEQTGSAVAMGEQAHFELVEDEVKPDLGTDGTPQPSTNVPASSSNSPSSTLPTSSNSPNMPVQHTAPKKKGTAATVKKAPKRPNNGGPKPAKRVKLTPPPGEAPKEESSDDDNEEDNEDDNGPYCLCRGPDDHRWMIFCENCEDWFHGECINLNKEIGESLIEKFICPNCTNENLKTLYKKSCAFNNCRKPARLSQASPSVFCSNEHAQSWWERMVAKLPKTRGKAGFNDQLIQEDFMALLGSGLSGLDEEGAWRLVKKPFSDNVSKGADGASSTDDDQFAKMLSDEEKEFLDHAATARFHLAEETLMCHKMLTLIDLAQDRRRAAIAAGRFGEDICGYDRRLDTIGARDAFAAFAKSPEGEVIFKASKMEDPVGEGDEARGMCERKRCKVHSGWQKMLALGIKHQIREMASQAAEVGEEENGMRLAAGERWRRKKAEKNWVEVLDR
ncbi:hypothetical protein EDB81DRAFT_714610 [Dactylonectria macrodidyma]|uniref:PHD-type domain-containing protein n=1 Tax=Dactylonectria macrodidyma TaxID=307937 RepID=A0A9P9JCB2_9HYPO|nr:hypothetical protein EDB81DRAFT_714610 [Dactylonectria macrodidyma]